MQINEGVIRTNSLCVGCSRCMTHCPSSGANVSVVSGGVRRVEVDDDKCVHCGLCIAACPHHAREYNDDTAAFFRDLSAGKRIALAIDPTFRILYGDRMGRVLGYLRSLGAAKIYDVSFGGDLCAWATLACCREQPDKCWISSDCPVTVEMVEKCYPELLDNMLPVYSPLMCLAVYVRKYLGDETDLAYIGPCIARKREAGACGQAGRVRYNVTFSRLFERLAGVDLSSAAEARPDLENPGLGCLYAVNSGLKEILGYFSPPDFDVRSVDDLCNYTQDNINAFIGDLSDQMPHPDVVGVLSSKLGCIGSPALRSGNKFLDAAAVSMKPCRRRIAARPDYGKTYEERLAMLNETFAELDPGDFRRRFVNLYKQPLRLPKDVLEHIFAAMNKNTPVSRKLDCGFCGYRTCKDMAKAVAYGANQVENCIHYTREEALRLYLTDDLTGIPNLASFKRDVKNLLWNHPDRKYLIACFDINNFKMVNELYGFAVGDRILKTIAACVAGFAKERGVCCRISGDHFALCLPNEQKVVDSLVRAGCCESMTESLDAPVAVDFGFYVIADRTMPVEHMLDYARLAQQTVKGSYERRCAFYDEAMRGKARREAWVTKEMKKALDEGQFVVYLQPQYDSRAQRMTGAEALVRWRHPDVGLIPPDSFVPVFEKNLFICRMDAYVREETCKLLRGWLDMGLPVVPVSVNLSRVDLRDDTLPGVLEGLVDKYKLPRGLLKLEVTESAYTDSPERLVKIVGKLREGGFSVEMDDFGSGYSSLNTLYKMPLDSVKLDMRFIAGCSSQRGRGIIQAVAQMMQLLRLPLVAEGVETAEQVEFLSDVGCHTIQGYYYSKPLPAAEFEAKLRGGDTRLLQDKN